jgi:hypothetical protein
MLEKNLRVEEKPVMVEKNLGQGRGKPQSG